MIIDRIKSKFSKRVLRFAAHRRLPWLAAHLLHWRSNSIPQPSKTSKAGARPYCALILSTNKDAFLDDIKESFWSGENFDLICWPDHALRFFASAFLSPSLNDLNYITNDAAIEATKSDYRAFLADIWEYYRKIRRVDVVMTAHFGYVIEREFGVALERAGTPFMVLHKENMNGATPIRREFWHAAYKRRGKFEGRKILVWNHIERELQMSSGVIDEQRVVVTGMPRLDRIHRWRRKHAGTVNHMKRPQVLFFAFSRREKLPEAPDDKFGGGKNPGHMWSSMSWGAMCEETHGAIVKIAREHPDFRVIVKTKGQTSHRADILKMLDAAGQPLPPNLDIVADGDPYRLIADSDVVVGFNTTGLLEALAAGKTVISPRFEEACDKALQDLIIDFRDEVTYAGSPEELVELICRHAVKPTEIPSELSPGTKRMLQYWVGNSDGASGRRVHDEVWSEICNSKT